MITVLLYTGIIVAVILAVFVIVFFTMYCYQLQKIDLNPLGFTGYAIVDRWYWRVKIKAPNDKYLFSAGSEKFNFDFNGYKFICNLKKKENPIKVEPLMETK